MGYTVEEIGFFFSIVALIMTAIVGFVLLLYHEIYWSIACFVFAGFGLIFLYIRHTKYRCPNCGELIRTDWDVCPYCGNRLEPE